MTLATRTRGFPAAPSVRDRRHNPTYAARGAASPQPAGPQPGWRRQKAFPGRPEILYSGETARPGERLPGCALQTLPAHSPGDRGGASRSPPWGVVRGGACRPDCLGAAGWKLGQVQGLWLESCHHGSPCHHGSAHPSPSRSPCHHGSR